MNMTKQEYDGALAVACIVLAVVLNALQICFIADGLVMASHQGYLMAVLMAIVISSGLFYSIFTSHRLWLKGQPRYYAWILGGLAGFLVGAMAAWSLSYSAEVGTVRWWLGLFLGLTIPGQTLALCKMTNGMLDLAGPGWWKQRKSASISQRPEHIDASETLVAAAAPLAAAPEFADATTVAPHSIGPDETRAKSFEVEEVRAIPAVSPAESSETPSSIIVSQTNAMQISITGDRIAVRVGSQLSNRRWKLFHSDLRRIPSISWDEARKASSIEGRADRTVEGTLRVQPIKGKKNRQKRRVARQQQIDAIAGRLKELVEQHSSN